MLFVTPKTSRAKVLHVAEMQHTVLVCFSSEVCRTTCSQARLETGSGKDVAGHLENMISVRNISVPPPNGAYASAVTNISCCIITGVRWGGVQ